MQYDSYHSKMKRVAAILARVYRHRVPIILGLAAFVLLVTVLVINKGFIFADSPCPAEVAYGDEPDYRAYAVLSRVTYEYSTSDSDTWTTETPRYPGDYRVRAVAKTAFGDVRYGDVQAFTIVKREITVSVKEKSISYGDELTVEADIAPWDSISYRIEYGDDRADNTEVWVVPYSISIVDENGVSMMAYYTIETPRTELTIKPVPLTITVNDCSKVYDRYMLTFDQYEITEGKLIEGDTLVALFKASQTNVGSVVNTPRLTIYSSDGRDMTGHYDITVSAGKLIVEKRPLIVRAGSATFVYNGQEQSSPDFTLDSSTSLADGQHLEVDAATSIIDCGTVENALTVKVCTFVGADVTSNYSVFVETGTLTVTPRSVTVESLNNSLIYNGTDQVSHELEVHNGVPEDDCEVITDTALCEVGRVVNRITVRFMRDGKDVSGNYNIGYEYGILTVEKRPITVTVASVSKEYDGTPLTSDQTMVSAFPYGLCDGHTATVRTVGEQTEIGASANRYVEGSLAILDGDRKDVTANYDVTVEEGTLTVTRRKLTVTTAGATKVYDDTPLTAPTYEITGGSLLDGHLFSDCEVIGTITDAGWVKNECLEGDVYEIVDGRRVSVAQYYDITYKLGVLTVTRRPITVMTHSDSWMYDGQAHKGQTELILDENTPLVQGHELVRVSDTPVTVTDAGMVKNAYEVEVMAPEGGGLRLVTHNYRITYDFGDLTVEKRPITLELSGGSWIYDGMAHSNPRGEVVGGEGLAYRHTIQFSTVSTFVEAGTYTNDCDYIIYDRYGIDATHNYDVDEVREELTIKLRPVRLTVKAEKMYDGQPLAVSELTASDRSTYPLVEGHTARGVGDRTQTRAGMCYVLVEKPTITITDQQGKSVLHNYFLTYEMGTLTVTPRPISIRTADAEKVYDGIPLTAPTFLLTPDSMPLVEGDTLFLTVTGSATEVGQYPNTFADGSLRIEDAEGNNVRANYEITSITEGTLTVKYDAAITVTTGSAVKYYDGLPLTCDTYTVELTAGTLPEGCTVYVAVTGRITKVGTADNTATVAVFDDRGNDITSLVTLVVKPGVLTVLDIGQQEEQRFGKVYADTDGLVYLRIGSYGDFNGQGWEMATAYGRTLSGGYSLNLLPAAVLKNLSTPSATLRFSDMRMFMLPYYTGIGGSAPVIGSDTVYNHDAAAYTADYYPFTGSLAWVESYLGLPAFVQKAMLGSYAADEAAYSQFVYRQYLTLDNDTRAYMQSIIAAEGFDADDPGVYAAVAAYIREAAVYNLDYDPALDSASNTAIAFLGTYKEGVCTHFATAATLLYRALGIPARYTVGFALEAKAGEWVEIGSPGHAWVEVYVNGLGWIQVEVTPADGNGSGGSGGSGGTDIPTDKPVLELTPVFCHKVYDGTYLYAADAIVETPALTALLNEGYTYTVRVAGSQREIGQGVSQIAAFTLYNAKGEDVTDGFRTVKSEGVLLVTGEPVKVCLYQLEKTYDGTPLTFREGDYEVLYLPEGVTLELTLTASLTEVGWLTLAELNRDVSRYADYRVWRDGVDVTADYPLVFVQPADEAEYPPLAVKARSVTLTSASEIRVADGTPLENGQVYLSRGSLAEGHTLEAVASGSITEVGSCENTITSVIIRDAGGHDVTANYAVTCIYGTLTLVEE